MPQAVQKRDSSSDRAKHSGQIRLSCSSSRTMLEPQNSQLYADDGLQILKLRDPGMAGVPIELYLDGGDGVFGSDGAGADAGTGANGDDDAPVDSTTSLATSGDYSFTVDQMGTYFVRMVAGGERVTERVTVVR